MNWATAPNGVLLDLRDEVIIAYCERRYGPGLPERERG